MSSVSTHVLDLVKGGPAEGIPVTLERQEGDAWAPVAQGVTNHDGRIPDFVPRGAALAGVFRITFQTADYLARTGHPGFYPYVPIVFQIPTVGQHYHVPLLLGPYGYSTYRGS